jgi:hypothetical protein
MLTKVIEISRIIMVFGGLGLSAFLSGGDAASNLHGVLLCLSIGLSGLSGIEGIFFGDKAAIALGRLANKPYQIQSGASFLSLGIVGIMVWCLHWGVHADAAVLLCILATFTLSAIVHVWEVFKLHNRNIKNAMRGVLMLSLLLYCIPLIMQALQNH